MRINIHHSRPTITNADIKAVSEVLKSNNISCGRMAKRFEGRFTSLLKVNSAVAVNSGTSALHLALLALGIKPHDEVILPSLVCSSVLDAVLYSGADPKIADIDLKDFNLGLEAAQKKITKKTKAIILPHLFGKPADIQGFLRLGVPLIENCAHSLGARYKGRLTGGFGSLSVFSFYATKVIATGYGGMVCARNKNLIYKIRDIIEIDERDDYRLRFNYKMSDMAASLGISQLTRLNDFISQRREIARFYNQNIKSKNILLPADTQRNHIYFRYVIRVKADIHRVVGSLNKKGIEVKRPVFKPLHHYLKLDKREFPVTDAVFDSAVSLPVYPSLKRSEAESIVRALKEVVD